MIFNFDYLKQNQTPKIVIIGSGPAGISLSLKLAEQGIPSLILEAGGEQWTELAHDTSIGKSIGDEYFSLDFSRLKFFGGSSNHWTGICRHLDEVDFKPRNDIEGHIGWPIGKADLDPFHQQAREILELSELMDEAPVNPYLKEIEFALSPPVRFAQKYLPFYKTSDKASVCLNAYVTSVAANNGRIARINVSGPNKEPLSIDVDTVVFCGGGIENSRLLLWSNEISPEPVTANPDILGRYWTEHPHNEAGEARIFRFPYRFRIDWDMGFFSPTPEAMAKYNILNACLRLRRPEELVKNTVRNAACFTQPLQQKTGKLLGRTMECTNSIELVWEQEARADNRIELSTTEKDVFGVPRPILYWKRSPLDYRTPKVLMELMGQHLAANNHGFIRSYEHIIEESDYPSIGWMAGCHHMGGTRMASSQDKGVVDRNLKIFGSDNGYIVGSSVFPTGGHANPTFTIVQLALRLAGHLGKRKQDFV